MKKNIILVLIGLFPLFIYAQIYDKLTVDISDIQFTRTDSDEEKIEWKTNCFTSKIGYPELPVYEVTYVLPVEAKVTDVKFINKERKLLKQGINIIPVNEKIPTIIKQTFSSTQPINNYYNLDNIYPSVLYEVKEDGFIQGYHVITLRIYPFQYVPQSKMLYYYPKLEYSINYKIELNNTVVKPLTQTEYRAELCKSYIKSVVKNHQDVEQFGSNVQNIRKNNKGSQKNGIVQRIKSISIIDDITPDYIIITNDLLKPTFQTLADWKTAKGVFTIIKTIEEIGQVYNGSDLQEKIRNYLIDSKNKWGDGLFVLLGGDINIIPSRFVNSEYSEDKSLYPADKYYSTTNNWLFNGQYFNYNSAYTTQTINFTGRIPVNNNQELNDYINKLIAYEHADQISQTSYYKNILIADAFMLKCPDLGYRSGNEKKSLKDYSVSKLLPLNLRPWLMFDDYNCSGTNLFSYSNNSICCYDGKYSVTCPGGSCTTGNEEFSKNNFIAALNNGSSSGNGKFHIIYHMDHSGHNGMGTSGKDKGESIGLLDFDGLNNGTNYQIMMSGGCHPANFAYDCMGKHYITKQNGGGVAFIGNTDVGWVGESYQFNNFCDYLYKPNGIPNNGRFDIGSIFQNVQNSGWRLHLLGDPEMQVWTDVPQALNCTTSVSAILLSEQQLGVTISNLPLGQKAYICIQKDTEIYTTQEVSTNGTYNIPIKVNTPGAINVTVTSHNFFPYETTVYANQSITPNLYVSSVDFKDGIGGFGIGDGNGKNDAGETINLGIEIKNTGINTANTVSATLTCNNPNISISSNFGNFGNINSGGIITTYQYNYTINKDAPEILSNASNPVQFTLSISDVDNNTWTHKFNIDIFNSNIKQRNKTVLSTTDGDLTIEPNETVTFSIDLQNVGQALGKNISAIITSNSASDIIQSCSNISKSYGDILQFETKNNTQAFQFTTGSGYISTSVLNFNLQITNDYGRIWNYQFNLNDKPSAVSNVGFSADVSEIDLHWTPVSGAVGYNIYRCNVGANDTESGVYERLNNSPVTFAFFNDNKNLDTLTKYFYKIKSVSNSGIESAETRILAWTSYPKKYLFPVTIDAALGNFSTSINAADVNNDGKKEIFVGTTGGNDKGCLVGLDYYGNDLFNIDNNVTTYSGFAKLGYVTTAIPAIGDLNRIGKSQIIQPTRDYGAGKPNAVYCYDVEDINPINNKPDLKWKVDVAEKQFYRGVIVSNIDNSANGSLEIVTYSDERGCISIYNSIGTLLQDIECVNTYAAISVADIDNDGDKEIIQASGTGIHVWHHNGTSYLGTSSLYSLSLSEYRFVTSVVVCDIDNDGQKEILTFAIQTNSPNYAKLFAIKNDGTLVSGFDGTQTITTNINWNQELAVGDLDNDGNLEIVTFANDGIKVWNNSAQLISSILLSDLVVNSQPILADVDGDNEAEIICGSTTNNNIYAFKMNGSLVMGFPLKTSMAKCGGINISDIDNDGKNELIATNSNRIEMWQTDGLPSRIEWGSVRHNQYNTGEYQTICEPTIINSNTTWNNTQTICGEIIVKSGTLTINNNSNISMSSTSMIIVMAGASLVIDSGHILNANIRAMSGSSITVTNNGTITLRSNAEFYSETGTNLDIQYGSIDKN